jgi:hypothetical protein
MPALRQIFPVTVYISIADRAGTGGVYEPLLKFLSVNTGCKSYLILYKSLQIVEALL